MIVAPGKLLEAAGLDDFVQFAEEKGMRFS